MAKSLPDKWLQKYLHFDTIHVFDVNILWIFHIISVFIPSAFYVTFILHRTGKEDEMEESAGFKDAEEKCKKEGRRQIKEAGFMKAYMIHIVIRTILEGGFLTFQYIIYGFVVPDRYECTRSPCPHRVDCFISRPMEKFTFVVTMYVVTSISFILGITEMIYLILKTLSEKLDNHYMHESPPQNLDPPHCDPLLKYFGDGDSSNYENYEMKTLLSKYPENQKARVAEIIKMHRHSTPNPSKLIF